MGHYCRACGRTRANEKFTGKGHKNHICKDCSGKAGRKVRRGDLKETSISFICVSTLEDEEFDLEENNIYEAWSYEYDFCEEGMDDDDIPF